MKADLQPDWRPHPLRRGVALSPSSRAPCKGVVGGEGGGGGLGMHMEQQRVLANECGHSDIMYTVRQYGPDVF